MKPKAQQLMTAVRAALRAGEEIMAIYTHPETDWEVERKADNSPLTLADRRAHAAIASLLEGTPWPLLSEEGAHAPYADREGWDTLWVVDPLDGTKEFLKRNGEFTVNIALVHAGVPVAGVIYVPVRDVLYVGAAAGWAAEDRSLALRLENAATLCPGSPDELSAKAEDLTRRRRKERPYRVVASRSHLNAETQAWIDRKQEELGQAVELCSAGSSLKLCLLAEREADAYPRLAPTMEWDTAAGDAILRAAGGRTLRMDGAEPAGQPLAYNKPDLHNPFFLAEAADQ